MKLCGGSTQSFAEALHEALYTEALHDGSAYDGPAYDGSAYNSSAHNGSTTEALYKSFVQSFAQNLRRASCRASVELYVEPLYTELCPEPLYTYRHCGLRENIYK
jgi:hypothetical protein